MDDLHLSDRYNIEAPAVLLVGKTGSGKSTLGNSLLGTEGVFEACNDANSVTKISKAEKLYIGDRLFNLVDTPGVFDTVTPSKETLDEISRVIAECAYDIQALIFVVEAGRFTAEQEAVVEEIKGFLGAESVKYMIVAFTKCNKKQTLANDLKFNDKLQRLVDETGHRWVIAPNPEIFDTDTSTFRRNIDQLKSMIIGMKAPYTIDLFRRVREARENELRRQHEERERAKKDQEEALERKIKEEAAARMEKQLREENAKTEEEKRRLQREFAQEMENINNRMLEAQQQHNATMQRMQRELDEALRKAATPPPRKGGSCFAIDTEVITSNGEIIPLSNIKIGDQILCRSPEGKLEFSEIYLFVDYDTQKITEYRTIRFTKPNGTKGRLSLTPDHHLFVDGTIDFAENLNCKHSELQILNGDSLVQVPVDEVSVEFKKGYVCILTRSGTLIADGVLCSCFCEVPPSPAMQVLGQIAFAPLRLYTRFFPSKYRSSEVHPYVQTLVDIVLLLDTVYNALVKPTNKDAMLMAVFVGFIMLYMGRYCIAKIEEPILVDKISFQV